MGEGDAEQPPVDEEEGHTGEQEAEEAREGLLADAILSLQADPEGRQGNSPRASCSASIRMLGMRRRA